MSPLFQKLVAFSRDHSLVAVGISNNQVSVRRYPSLQPAFNAIHLPGLGSGDLYDIDFDESGKFVRPRLSPSGLAVEG